MTFFRTAPTYNEPLITGKVTTASWYRWFQSIDKGEPPSSEVTVAVSGSPFIYTAPSKGFAIITGGTVSQIEFSRTAGTFYPTGQTTGTFPVNSGDKLQITFSAPPSVIFVPQ